MRRGLRSSNRTVCARLTRWVGGVVHFLGSDGADFGPFWLKESAIFDMTLT